jgi:hypothetical protein
MALFGWKTDKMAPLYTRKADRRLPAASAGPLLAPPAAQTPNENLPHLRSGAGASAKHRAKSGA